MKKTYMKPESKAIEILKENFIATSAPQISETSLYDDWYFD